MTELKPCPFCGGEVEHQIMWDGAYSFTCPKCGLNARFTDDIARAVPEALEESEKLWNIRYEPTCHIVKGCNGLDACSECNQFIPYDSNYCPNCGCKVVEE